MARPTTKKDLIQAGNEQYGKLGDLIDSIPEQGINEIFRFNIEKEKGAHWNRDRNIRDVLIHLHEWHNLLLDWVAANQKGVSTQFLKEGYNWKNYGAMNEEFWEKHQNTSYETAVSLLKESHEQVMKLAESFSNDELFSKGVFDWVGTSSLGSYFVSTTASHYDWAMKKIRKHKKTTL